MKLTPIHLEILIHHFVSPEPFSRNSDTIQEYHNDLLGLELLETGASTGIFCVTDKGKAWLEHILETPMPTMKWTWE